MGGEGGGGRGRGRVFRVFTRGAALLGAERRFQVRRGEAVELRGRLRPRPEAPTPSPSPALSLSHSPELSAPPPLMRNWPRPQVFKKLLFAPVIGSGFRVTPWTP